MLFYDKRLVKMMIDAAGKRRANLVLDVGTGQGTDAVLLSKDVGQVVALDISINALRTAKALSRFEMTRENMSFVLADAEQLPFRENTFDLVCCKDVLHHVTDSLLTVLEMKRVAKKQARLIAVEANAYNPQMVIIGLIYHSVDSGVFRNTSTKLAEIFHKAGLSSVDVTETEVLPRQTLFEYRSPVVRVLGPGNSAVLKALERIESNWQRHKILRKFSNYLVVSGLKTGTL